MTATFNDGAGRAAVSSGVASRSEETVERYENCVARLLTDYQLEEPEDLSLPGYAIWLKNHTS